MAHASRASGATTAVRARSAHEGSRTREPPTSPPQPRVLTHTTCSCVFACACVRACVHRCVRAAGACKACADKPRFGGKGTKKQRCVARQCTNPKPIPAEHDLTDGGAGHPKQAKAKAGSTLDDACRPACQVGSSEVRGPGVLHDDTGEAAQLPPAAESGVDFSGEPPRLTGGACTLPNVFTIAPRPPDLPPWTHGRGPGPFTKSMVLEARRTHERVHELE